MKRIIIPNIFNVRQLSELVLYTDFDKYFITDNYGLFEKIDDIIEKIKKLETFYNLQSYIVPLFKEFLNQTNLNLKYETNFRYILKDLFTKYVMFVKNELDRLQTVKNVVTKINIKECIEKKVLNIYEIFLDLHYKENNELLQYLLQYYNEYLPLNVTLLIRKTEDEVNMFEDATNNALTIKYKIEGEDFILFRCLLYDRRKKGV